MWNVSSESWNFHPRRNLSDGEMEEWASLSHALSMVNLNESPDLWCWNLEKDGTFSSKSLSLLLSSSRDWICKDLYIAIWKGSYPKKVKFYIWELSHSCLNTYDKLQRRSPWISLSPSCCILCKPQGIGGIPKSSPFLVQTGQIFFGSSFLTFLVADCFSSWCSRHSSSCTPWSSFQDSRRKGPFG